MGRPFIPEQEVPEEEAMVAERIAHFPRTTGRFISPEYTIASPPERSKGNLEEEGAGHELAKDHQNTGTSETSHKKKRKGKGKKDKLKNLGNSGF